MQHIPKPVQLGGRVVLTLLRESCVSTVKQTEMDLVLTVEGVLATDQSVVDVTK